LSEVVVDGGEFTDLSVEDGEFATGIICSLDRDVIVLLEGLEVGLNDREPLDGNIVLLERSSKLTAAYDDVNRKLAGSLQQYDVTIKRLTIVEADFKTLKMNFDGSMKACKDAESKLSIFNSKVSELTTVNNNLTQVKVKLEKGLAAVSHDYDDIARELKLADDRANKAGHDAQHFEGLLREESSKLVKLNTAKQSLESEVKSLSIRIEEIESTAMVSSKRTIQKMEMRITELETIIDTEKKSHSVTMMELHKKERSIKELILQSEEDRKNIIILQESLDKLNEKIKMYKRQLEEQESISNSNIMRANARSKAPSPAPKKPSPLSTSSAPANASSLPQLPAAKRKSVTPRWSSRRPSTRSTSSADPPAPSKLAPAPCRRLPLPAPCKPHPPPETTGPDQLRPAPTAEPDPSLAPDPLSALHPSAPDPLVVHP
jgi:hypothetical protein